MNDKTIEQFVDTRVKGMQEAKAKRIVTVDMQKLDAPCVFFIICEGNSSTHVASIATEVKNFVREVAGIKPFAIDGLEAANWVAMDYGQLIVHVFQPEIREFYDIEHLWSDAELNEIADID